MRTEEILSPSQDRYRRNAVDSEFGAVKVAFLDQSGQLGGAELMLLDLIPELGLDSRVILLEGGPFQSFLLARGIGAQTMPACKKANIAVRKQAGLLTLIRAVPGAWGTARWVARNSRGADLLYANTPKAWIIAALVARGANLRLICHLHDILSAGHFSSVNRRVLVWAANHVASAVIANSRASADAFIQAGGRAELVTVIPNGFNLALFEMEPVEPHVSLREEHDIGDAPLVVMAGRLSPWKGQHVFIRALSQLSGVHGIIVGDALFTGEDRRYSAGLHELSQSLGCADRIHFCGFRRDMPDVLRQADVVAHCSVEPEPFGRVIVEAMLCGRPVVVSGHGGALEIVEDGKTGLYHAPGDATGLAARIRELIEDPARSREIGTTAREFARERYALPNIAHQTLQVIHRVCATSSVESS